MKHILYWPTKFFFVVACSSIFTIVNLSFNILYLLWNFEIYTTEDKTDLGSYKNLKEVWGTEFLSFLKKGFFRELLDANSKAINEGQK